MKLKIVLPSRVFLESPASKISAEGPQGSFSLLPRHIDFVSSLVPGLFSYVPEDAAKERFLALDRGMLVKNGDEVMVATGNAVAGELGELEEAVSRMLEVQSEQERRSRTSVARMEADFVKRFVGFGHG